MALALQVEQAPGPDYAFRLAGVQGTELPVLPHGTCSFAVVRLTARHVNQYSLLVALVCSLVQSTGLLDANLRTVGQMINGLSNSVPLLHLAAVLTVIEGPSGARALAMLKAILQRG